MPANVILDRLFNITQRVTNRHEKHGISSEVALIARQGLILAMEDQLVRRAHYLPYESAIVSAMN